MFDERSFFDRRPVFVSDIFAHTELLAAPVFDAANERTRPNLKVQDGCDNRCSFCVIPYVRGQSRSMKTEQILQEVNALVAAGYRELVISGINLGRWGRDLEPGVKSQVSDSRNEEDGTSREGAVHARGPEEIARTPGIEGVSRRLATEDRRLTYPTTNVRRPATCLSRSRHSGTHVLRKAPHKFGRAHGLVRRTDRLGGNSPRIAKHAHVPMQSGSDAVLRRMHRKYRPWHYREKIEKIRAAMPTAAIGADVMVGFPGETDAEFEETRRMIEDLPFTYLHVFTYSARPGTPAADMGHQVRAQVARERSRVLRELGEEKKLEFMRTFVGKTLEAITLAGSDKGSAGALSRDARQDQFTEALTDNYLKLRLNGKHAPNLWIHARVSQVENSMLVATTETALVPLKVPPQPRTHRVDD